ncbi:MAG: hypothetical protein OIF50_11715, partial [Flavobacteriaceae bacterium]|nr:hypothetical protein [Flavobacteriaceae bacterium]
LRGPLFILDRQAGTFSYTDNAQQEHIYDFKHIKIREGANPMLYYTKEKPVFIHKPFWRSFSKDYRQAWSFCVWYMDKNRPLPPDRIFYPYRDADFERRKAEGFPPPLYKSQISTREATPEQHAEREQYWKDKDYLEKQPTVML